VEDYLEGSLCWTGMNQTWWRLNPCENKGCLIVNWTMQAHENAVQEPTPKILAAPRDASSAARDPERKDARDVDIHFAANILARLALPASWL
jgi:hypothetical protein